MSGQIFVVPPHQQGQRLDKALEGLLPELSLRARRRLWKEGAVLVNGRPRPAGYTVREGDEIELGSRTVPARSASLSPGSLPGNDSPRLLEAHGDVLFVHKPAGLHTVCLPGRGGASLEEVLPGLLSGVLAERPGESVHLLNRLDCGTSGLVLAVRGGEASPAARDWRATEDAGLCHKSYLALLCGHLAQRITVAQALDTDSRRVSRVLPDLAPPLRHTLLEPLALVQAGDLRGLAPWSPSLGTCPADTPLTLAHCAIRKGARHQIRAHAAHAGFALWGDGRYGALGSTTEEDAGLFVLHHGLLRMPGLAVVDACPWLDCLPEKITNDITQWVNVNKTLP